MTRPGSSAKERVLWHWDFSRRRLLAALAVGVAVSAGAMYWVQGRNAPELAPRPLIQAYEALSTSFDAAVEDLPDGVAATLDQVDADGRLAGTVWQLDGSRCWGFDITVNPPSPRSAPEPVLGPVREMDRSRCV